MTRVRPARAADTEPIRETHVAAIEAFGPEAYDERAVAAWADRGDDHSLEGLHDPDTYWVVAERENESESGPGGNPPVAGFGRLDAAGAEGEVVAVYVHPDYARSGVGSAVLSNLEGYARGTGLTELALIASLNAVGFYERLGYERTRAVTHETSHGVELDCVEMRKRL
ncbi:GNAT family N-acetyltransferase [Halosimplex amylolyticum]|uniref:GNAT family N-acetyltransferase n=1 Tax=Halosimplex amylolyticum TaxID=3396616 RepID=UPI003F56BD3F